MCNCIMCYCPVGICSNIIRTFNVNYCHHFQANAVDVCVDCKSEKRVYLTFGFGLLLFLSPSLSLSLFHQFDVTMSCFMLLLLFLLYVFQTNESKNRKKQKKSKRTHTEKLSRNAVESKTI